MTSPMPLDPLLSLSNALAGLVATAAQSAVSVVSRGSRSSGFVWKPGLVVTADEALAEEGEISVILPGGVRVVASLAGRDASTDVALLRAETAAAVPVTLDTAVPPAGALALAVGASEGSSRAAMGLVSASGEAWRSMRGGEIDARLELDLALGRSSEGGLAVDAGGRAFGMTVFGPRRRVLVIPSATILRVAAELETRGKVARGYLGLGLQPVRLNDGDEVGAMVMSVVADGPAARAGVHQGDVILAWNGEPVGPRGTLLRELAAAGVGATVTLSLKTAGARREVDLVIGERP
jgi:S1-C subfamily serine protease